MSLRLALSCLALLAVPGQPAALRAADPLPPPVDGPEAAAPTACGVRPGDSVWLVSTRHLGCPTGREEPAELFRVLRLNADGTRAEADLTQLVQEDQRPSSHAETKNKPCGAGRRPLTVFVHGNRESWDTAVEGGLLAYQCLAGIGCRNGAPVPAPAMRFVIWSWPSDRLRRPSRDVRWKAERCDLDAYYLALFLTQVSPDEPTGLLGFSFGARIITGSLHLLGGGTLCGWQVPQTNPRPEHSLRVVLLAAAEHDYWLRPDATHGRCWSQVDQLLLQFNPCDRVLSLYPLIERCVRPPALGHAGFRWVDELGADAPRLHQQDVAAAIGSKHLARRYMGTAEIMAVMQRYVLWLPLP
jgi:hypothetical protein